jgi:hypothetical protein
VPHRCSHGAQGLAVTVKAFLGIVFAPLWMPLAMLVGVFMEVPEDLPIRISDWFFQ